MMNALEEYLAQSGTNEIEAMNRLQDEGIISDNCVTAADVSDGDCHLARMFLLGAYFPGRAEAQGALL